MRKQFEQIAEQLGIPYSDFVRMSMAIGVRKLAGVMGIEVEVDNSPQVIAGVKPGYLETKLENEHYPMSNGEIPDDLQGFEAHLLRLGVGERV